MQIRYVLAVVMICTLSHHTNAGLMGVCGNIIKGTCVGSAAYTANTATGAYIARHVEDANSPQLLNTHVWKTALTKLHEYGGVDEKKLAEYAHYMSQYYRTISQHLMENETHGYIARFQAYENAMKISENISEYLQEYPHSASIGLQSASNYILHRVMTRGAPRSFTLAYFIVQGLGIYIGTRVYHTDETVKSNSTPSYDSSDNETHDNHELPEDAIEVAEQQEEKSSELQDQPSQPRRTPIWRSNLRQILPTLVSMGI